MLYCNEYRRMESRFHFSARFISTRFLVDKFRQLSWSILGFSRLIRRNLAHSVPFERFSAILAR